MNILIPFTILILSWSMDNTDPRTQHVITYIFTIVHGLAFISFIYMSYLVYYKGESTPLQVKDPYTGEVETKKSYEYDASKLRELFFTKITFSAGISLFLATRYGLPFPLLLQCLNNPKSIYDSEVFKIYVLGEKAEGPLQRPWPETGMVPEWVKGIWAQGAEDSQAILQKHDNLAKKKK